ncbi:hypothetical protein AMTR_s00017p00095430 [Amborella trichopoda]|uniref:Uncharacterized protein n=1 Tax=Amborella trichopoda TaxID=13333 RepID=W1PKI9_AMBTC|nr:hypothetical protein AMTR_s00017p00095430 [Amborella trichopoda]
MGSKAPKGEIDSLSLDLEVFSKGKALALPQRSPKLYQEPKDKALKAPQLQKRWLGRKEVWRHSQWR